MEYEAWYDSTPHYGWIIDKDHLYGGEDWERDDNGTLGPRNLPPELEAKLKAGKGDKFKLFDDDGVLSYEGRIIGNETGYDGFEPLDDFGMPNAGCTYIKYRDKGRWTIL